MRRNQKNHKRRSTKLVQRPLIYTWYLPSNLLPSSVFLLPSSDFHRTDIRYIRYIRYIRPCESVAELPSSFFRQLIAGNTFGSGGQLHCTGDSNGNSFVKNRWYNVLFVKLRRAD